ncbi:hypothetical protein ACERK3_07255 [Phycisphaerales bacterium AB-hyl4]|uniref:Alpha-galactosidase n=1 Tax=Natronomicrosphaera hydrolytica TaxID=3242702 RepID=A0ABV4U3C8_9BACT
MKVQLQVLRDTCKRVGTVGVLGSLFGVTTAFGAERSQVELLEPSHFGYEQVTFTEAPVVSQDGNLLRAKLANGVELRFDVDAVQLQAATREGVILAESDSGNPFYMKYIPAGTGPDVEPYAADLSFTFQRAIAIEESLTFWLEATASDGETSLVRWTVYPVDYVINGMTFSGIADQFFIQDDSHYLHEMYMNWRGPVGEHYEGARTFRFSCYPGNQQAYSEATFSRSEPKSLGDYGMFIDGGQMFNLIGLPGLRGSILEFMDEPFHCRAVLRSTRDNDAVEVGYRIGLGRVGPVYTTPLRFRLSTQETLSSNLWIQITQFTKAKFQNDLAIEPTDPRPMAVVRNAWRNSSFVEHADELLPIIKEYGYRQVEIGWVWKRGHSLASRQAWPAMREWDGSRLKSGAHFQGDFNGEITEVAGGAAGLADFTAKAHDMGIKVYVWHQTAHGWVGSPDVRNNPEWLVHRMDGHSVLGWHNSERMPVVWYDMNSGWKDETLRRFQRIKEQTNIDGLWLDVYATGSTCNYLRPVSTYSMPQRSAYIRALREMGYEIQTEGVSLASVDSFVLRKDDMEYYREHPFILFGSCPFRMGATSGYGQLDLFKLMSYRSFPHDRGEQWRPTDNEEVERTRQLYADEVRYRNHCFNTIEDRLGAVIGVVEIEGGTQWVCERGNALFLWDDTDVEIMSPSQMVLDAILTPGGDKAAAEIDALQGQRRVSVPAQSVMLFTSPAN